MIWSRPRLIGAGVVLLIAALFLSVYWHAGSLLVGPSRRPVPPSPPDLHVETVTIRCRSGAELAAWLLTPSQPRGAVLVLHGIHADRSMMLPRAQVLLDEGYASLLPNLRAHGDSNGQTITLGHLEAMDAIDAMAVLRDRFPGLPIGGIGVSLGGAAMVLAGEKLRADALVLESVFPSIEAAADNRIAMRVGPLSRVLTPLLLLQLKLRLGIGAADLRPVDVVGRCGCPVLIMSGTTDQHTTEAETRELFAAAAEPKELWLVPGAAHIDLHPHAGVEYRRRVVGFFERYLQAPGGGQGGRVRHPDRTWPRRRS